MEDFFKCFSEIKGYSKGNETFKKVWLEWVFFHFFMWGVMTNFMFVSPLAYRLEEMKDCITATLSTIGGDVLQRGWNEFKYRVDVFCKHKLTISNIMEITWIEPFKIGFDHICT